jgi:hypothetical protein
LTAPDGLELVPVTHQTGYLTRLGPDFGGVMLRLFRLWRLGAKDLRLLWFALRHPHRPVWLVPAAIFLLLYALEPLNLALPALGAVDDFILLPLILHGLVLFLPADIRLAFARSALPR